MFFGALRRRPRASPPLTRSLDIRTRRLTSGMDADLAVVPHDADRLALERRRAQPTLDRGRHETGAERLGQIKNITGPRAVVADHPVRMHLADHRVAELRLCVVHGVASHDRHARLTQLARAT